jgi:hypothetical protein
MKLVFPGGEHPQVLLSPGLSSVGSDPAATIVLSRPGILPQHCQLRVTQTGVMLEVPSGTAVSEGFISLRPGDTVTFDEVVARLASLSAPALRQPSAIPGAANDDPGMTAVRKAMPKYVLRGVTGGVFGRTYPVEATLTVGRAPQCDICINDPGLSRIHAKLTPTEDGLLVEDQNSTNGSCINGLRIQRQLAHVGDEISFDSVRFTFTGAAHAQQASTRANTPNAADARGKFPVVAMVAACVAAIGVAILVWLKF